MSTRRSFMVATAAASSLAALKSALAQPTPQAPGEADFLFVQGSKGMTFDKANNKFTLTGVSPVTVFFTDRPERIAGNMKTTAFIPFWSGGKDSFKSNPPNADISLLEGKTLNQIVVELQDPVLVDDNLTYSVNSPSPNPRPGGADWNVRADELSAGRPPSMRWPMSAAIRAITTVGRHTGSPAGPMPTYFPISAARNRGRAAPAFIAAAMARWMSAAVVCRDAHDTVLSQQYASPKER